MIVRQAVEPASLCGTSQQLRFGPLGKALKEADPKALAVYDAFERATYQLADAP